MRVSTHGNSDGRARNLRPRPRRRRHRHRRRSSAIWLNPRLCRPRGGRSLRSELPRDFWRSKHQAGDRHGDADAKQRHSQLFRSPVGMVSLFGFKTPIPYPFGSERTGYLVTDIDTAIKAAAPLAPTYWSNDPDPIGRNESSIARQRQYANLLALRQTHVRAARDGAREPGLPLARPRRQLRQ